MAALGINTEKIRPAPFGDLPPFRFCETGESTLNAVAIYSFFHDPDPLLVTL
jgi:hypothetical protein